MNKDELANLGKVIDLDRMLEILKQEDVIDKKATWDKVPFYKPKPSPDSEDGYQSRIGLHEVLKVTESVKELILKGESADSIEAEAKRGGMTTMVEDGIFKAVQGITSVEEVLRVISTE